MKRRILILIILILSTKVKAQIFSIIEDRTSANAKVDKDPLYPGGFQAFNSYVDAGSLKLKPNHAIGWVVVEFIVEQDGRVTNSKILESLSTEVDSLSIILIKNSPKWKPGFKNGLPVKTEVKLQLRFNSPIIARVYHPQQVVLTPGHNTDVEIDETVPVNNKTNTTDLNQVFSSVEQEPQYPGGVYKLNEFIKKNRKTNIPSNNLDKVIIQFIVEKDGSITNIKILRGPSDFANEDALRLIKSFPKWIPGMQNGHVVRVYYTIPI